MSSRGLRTGLLRLLSKGEDLSLKSHKEGIPCRTNQQQCLENPPPLFTRVKNEAGILTARKDLDYIGRDELLEALKRQKGTFETGQEDTTEIPEELRLRLAYREAAVAVIACYFPEPLRPFVEPAKYVL
ncbi:unnamed protein product [Vicia faba]|uniref:Uncharacterized protein n=1 Tax=Vicia faba TaxID=3906 RepID=A0AAV0YHD8_VICFA|nr:unnamed protein product [Vicia faba]